MLPRKGLHRSLAEHQQREDAVPRRQHHHHQGTLRNPLDADPPQTSAQLIKGCREGGRSVFHKHRRHAPGCAFSASNDAHIVAERLDTAQPVQPVTAGAREDGSGSHDGQHQELPNSLMDNELHDDIHPPTLRYSERVVKRQQQ